MMHFAYKERWFRECMQTIKKYIFYISFLFCLYAIANTSCVHAYSISTDDFQPLDSSEIVVGYTSIGYWNNGSFFETVTRQKVGNDAATGYDKYRFRHYITHRGNPGSYIYQLVPVCILVDGTIVAEFDARNSGNVSNTTKLWGEHTLALSPDNHTIQLADMWGGAITQVNVTWHIQIPNPSYTVRFVDYDGRVLRSQTVEAGKDASPPPDPTLSGYQFTGWHGDYHNVTSDRTITAQYNVLQFTVNFMDWDNRIIKSETVRYGGNANPPPDPIRTGYTFLGWNGAYTNVTSNKTITATYKIKTFSVLFDTMGGTPSPFNENVIYGDTVAKPPNPKKENATFMGWFLTPYDATIPFDFSSAIVANTVLYAKWDQLPVLKAEDMTIFSNTYTKLEWEQLRDANASAYDVEDLDLSKKIKVVSDTVDLHAIGDYHVMYKVSDHVGNKVTKEIQVHVIDKRAMEDRTTKYIRSIDKTYLDTLHTSSIWRTQAHLQNMLHTTLNQTHAQESWVVSAKDIKKIKAFNKTHEHSAQANAEFLRLFAHLRQP